MKLFNRKKKSNLPMPINQLSEALYLLLSEPQTRLTFMQKAFIMNAPDCVMRLRNSGVGIDTTPVNTINKYGRPVSHCFYSLTNEYDAKKYYLEMVSKNEKGE